MEKLKHVVLLHLCAYDRKRGRKQRSTVRKVLFSLYLSKSMSIRQVSPEYASFLENHHTVTEFLLRPGLKDSCLLLNAGASQNRESKPLSVLIPMNLKPRFSQTKI